MQCYLQPDEYEWFQNFMHDNGFKNESAAVRLCIRHVKIEHGMKERGYNSTVAKHEVEVENLLGLRGTNHGDGQD